MKTYKSESNHVPKEWDTTSSMRVVYHNYHVKQIERHSDIDEETAIRFVYDVDEYTKEEYRTYMVEKNRADIDYIAIMSEVEL